MEPRDLYLALRYALTASRLYPAGSRVRAESVERLAEVIANALDSDVEGVSFSFVEEGAYVGGDFVAVEGEDDGEPISSQLFQLGVRELRFLPGLAIEELQRLLDILTLAGQGMLNPVDEDLSILLWESDLTHVGYLLYDEGPAVDETEFELDEESADSEGMLFCHEPMSDFVDQELTIGDDDPTGWATQLNEAERLGVLANYRSEVEEEIPFKYGRLLVEILRIETDSAEGEHTEKVLIEYLDALVATDRYGILLDLESSLDRDDESPETAEHARRLEPIRCWFQRADLYIRASQLCCEHPGDEQAAHRFLERVPVGVLPDLISLALDERADLPSRVLESFREQIRTKPEAQRLLLGDSRPELRRLALEELTEADPETGRRIRVILTDPDPELRTRAVLALTKVSGPPPLTPLSQALADPEEAVRVAAARALGETGGSRALEILLRIIVAKDFSRKGIEEKRAFFHAAGSTAPREVLPVLARLAEDRGFWPSKEREERAEAALEALSRLGPEARDFLRARWKRKRSGLLRRFDALWQAANGETAASGQEAA